MAHAFNARDCSLLPVIEMSQGDLISKSILVKNISPATRKEDIIIHFQRKRNGGGEVDCVRLLGERTAVVTFEKSEVAESVMKKPQEIDGCLLTVESFGRTVSQQVFGEVSGRLNPNALGMSYSSLKTILEKLEDEAEVKWKEIFDGFVVSGTFQQMKGVNVLLKTKLKEKKLPRRVGPVKQFGEAWATGQASTLPQCNLNEFNTCPKPLPENGQLKIKPTERNPTKNSERQIPVSDSAQVRVNQTYRKSKMDCPTLPAANLVSNIDSFSANSYPSFEPGRFSASSTSENCQQGQKEVDKRVESTSFKGESDFTSDFAMLSRQLKIGGDPLHVLPQVKDSDNENKGTSEGNQINGETKHLAENSLVESLEISESKSKDAIPDSLSPSSKKYKPRNGCDVQCKPNLPDGINSENESATFLPALNEVSPQAFAAKTETNESRRDDRDVHCKRNFPDGMKGENKSIANLPGLNRVSIQVNVEKTETNESQRDDRDVQCKPNSPDGINSKNESATFLPALNEDSPQAYAEKTGTNESRRDDRDVQCKPNSPDGINSENESATFLPALNEVSPQAFAEKTGTNESRRDDRDVQCKPNSPDGINSENESATFLPALNEDSPQAYAEKTGTNESQRDDRDVQCKPNSPDGIKSENGSVTILPAPLNKVSTQFYVGNTEMNERQRDCSDFQSKPNLLDGTKSENGSAVIAPAASHKVSPQLHVKKPEINESQRDDCEVQSKPNFPDQIKRENTSAAIPPALNKVSPQDYVAKTDTDNSERAATATEKARQRQENGGVTEKHWSFDTSTGITIKLLVGDITSEDGDVLLCPANSNLSYDEGLSKLILDKGGQAMRDECLRITQSGGPLKDGATVMTSGGNLPFKSVLHAVLPPWTDQDQVQNEKAIKLRIHKCLKEGFALASGHRMKSISLPPLGQSWINIPIKISAEIIARVVAIFSKNVGPMHTGITDVRIVCEDEEIFNVFFKEFSSCTIQGENPFIVSGPLKNDLKKGGEVVGSASTMRCQDIGETKVSLFPKGTSSPKPQKKESKPKPVLLVNGNHTPEQRVTKSISPLQPTNLSKEDTIVEKGQAESRPKPGIIPASQIHAESNGIHGDCHSEDGNEDKANSEWHVCETKISFDPSSFVELTEVSVTRAFETLEVNEASKVEEKTVKCMYVQDKLNTSENSIALSIDNTSPLNEEEKVTVTNNDTEKAVAEISKHMESVSLRPEIECLSRPKEKNANSECTELYVHQGFSSDERDRSSPVDQRTCDPFSVHMNDNFFITSPTVDGLLTADLHLGFRGLELWYGKDPNDRSSGNQASTNMSTTSKENKSFSNYQKTKKSPLLGTFCNATEVHKKRMTFEKKMKKEKADSDLYSKTASQQSRITKGVNEDGELGPEKGDEFDATTKEESGVTGTAESCHLEEKPYVSKSQPLLPCALCQESVDHPDLTNPNICSKHKFCDDCILRAFTFSSSCPACMNEAGLTIAAEENVNENRGAQQSYNSNPTSLQNIDDRTRWTANPPAAIQANQPPGQMMWKKYETSLPGFEGYGTIAVSFCFYDGIQSSEHPNPGNVYKGATCVAYIPATQEGKEILKLLQKAFDARLIFTVLSSASDKTGVIALDGIELKTSAESSSRNGYPDPGYLSRLRQQLSGKGIP